MDNIEIKYPRPFTDNDEIIAGIFDRYNSIPKKLYKNTELYDKEFFKNITSVKKSKTLKKKNDNNRLL